MLSEVTKMSKINEGIAGFVRWLVVCIISSIIVLPTWMSLTYEV